MPISLLHGDNALEIDDAAARLRQRFADVDVLQFDGATTPLGPLSEACRTAGLFDPERLVIVRGLHERLKGAKKETETEEVRRLLNALAPTTTLLLLSPGMGEHPLIDYVREAEGTVRSFSLPRKNDLPRWAIERARKSGATLDRDAAEVLTDLTGADALALQNELDKLSTYAGAEEHITPAMVEVLVGAVPQDSIFALVDAVAGGDRATALGMLHTQLGNASGTPIEFALYLIRMLARQARILLRIRLGQQAHRSQGQIVSELKLPRYYADRYFRQAKRLSVERLVDMFEGLASLEFALKSGLADATTGLDLFIAEVCA